jgi:hypothetical protein
VKGTKKALAVTTIVIAVMYLPIHIKGNDCGE